MADLLVFRCRERTEQLLNEPEPRYVRRLSDQITASFYEACRIGNLEAAGQLLQALECEIARSARLPVADGREDGHDLAAMRERFLLEMQRRERDVTTGTEDRPPLSASRPGP